MINGAVAWIYTLMLKPQPKLESTVTCMFGFVNRESVLVEANNTIQQLITIESYTAGKRK